MSEHECPKCGESFYWLAPHIPECTGEATERDKDVAIEDYL